MIFSMSSHTLDSTLIRLESSHFISIIKYQVIEVRSANDSHVCLEFRAGPQRALTESLSRAIVNSSPYLVSNIIQTSRHSFGPSEDLSEKTSRSIISFIGSQELIAMIASFVLIDKLLKKSSIIGLLCWILQKKWVIHCENKNYFFVHFCCDTKNIDFWLLSALSPHLTDIQQNVFKNNIFYTSLASLICLSVHWLRNVSSIDVNQYYLWEVSVESSLEFRQPLDSNPESWQSAGRVVR